MHAKKFRRFIFLLGDTFEPMPSRHQKQCSARYHKMPSLISAGIKFAEARF